MIQAKGYAAKTADSQLDVWNFERREPLEHDVLIEILYCGVCHSDIHQVRNEWGGSLYPIVPGHEIVGRVTNVGTAVTKYKQGDLVGVGCMVDSCQECESCHDGVEQFCKNTVYTYSSYDKDGSITYGGYSNRVVVNEKFVLSVSEKLPIDAVAPLLCAGITTYSPIFRWEIGKGHKVAVLGLGGLGHMAVKFAVSLGAEVTVLSTSAAKEKDAYALGAHKFVLTSDKAQTKAVSNTFHFIIDTVSASHNYDMYLKMLKTYGVHICVGIPPEAIQFLGFNMIGGNKTITGSSIGGIKETQEMLDYCAEHNIVSDVEIIPIQKINEAYERMIKGDVHYRFVIDMQSLNN